MTTTAWAHLPNAKHIDAVLADVNARPEVWAAALIEVKGVLCKAVRAAAWRVALDVAIHAGRYLDRRAALDADLDTTPATVWDASSDVTTALIAWDEAGDLVDLPPDVLRTMVDLAPEPVNHQAAMLLPWAIVKTIEESKS